MLFPSWRILFVFGLCCLVFICGVSAALPGCGGIAVGVGLQVFVLILLSVCLVWLGLVCLALLLFA